VTVAVIETALPGVPAGVAMAEVVHPPDVCSSALTVPGTKSRPATKLSERRRRIGRPQTRGARLEVAARVDVGTFGSPFSPVAGCHPVG
jgi:hypothetical protein